MIIAIIAGGSGTRLWPLSQPDYPKHLLKLTGKTSLLQNTYKRAKTSTDIIYVITEASHAHEVKAQLPDLAPDNVIIEPARRGTASCIILALATIQAKYPDEEVVFIHADHHIVDVAGFAKTAAAASEASRKHGRITLIGLRPTYPATGFGYIRLGEVVEQIDGLDVHVAKSFKEKPDFETAQDYVATGQYLWNLGLFAAPINVFTKVIEAVDPALYQGYLSLCAATKEEIADRYLQLESQPIEIAVIEKTDQILIIPGEFDWADIGSFLDLHKLLATKKDGNAVKGEVYQVDCTDSMVHGSTKPIIAVGLSGIVVIDTPEGLLVCAKEESQRVGDLVKEFQKQQHKA